MRSVFVAIVVFLSASIAARAEDMIANRPGLMCRSADALARLTLPNGDSRTHASAPKPADLQIAAAGGCIDIPPEARVTVRQAFHNTSIVTYGSADDPPFVVPNIDFRPAEGIAAAGSSAPVSSAPVSSAPAPAGYAVAQRLLVAGPGSEALVVLVDRRLDAKLREKVWGTGGLEMAPDQADPRLASVTRTPLLNARLQLVSPAGKVLAERRTEYPLAKIEPAPIHGLPSPIFLFTVDMSAGFGGFSGPDTVLLMPEETQLAPVQVMPERGKRLELDLARTLHSAWAIVPARDGGPEEIEAAVCPGGDGAHLVLETFRFADGQWHGLRRDGGECGDVEVMPPRSAFP